MADDPIVEQPAAGDPWHKGADPELLGVLQARGLADKTAIEAVANLSKAHIEAEKLIGVPAEQVVRWPKDANDTANWTALRTRLGVPGEATGYDFSTVKDEAGNALVDGKFADTLRTTFHKLNIPAEAGVELARTLTAFAATEDAADRTAETARVAAEVQALKTSWGGNYDANRTAALGVLNSMLEKSGMSKEDAATAINTLEGLAGGSKVMEMFRAFSSMTREDDPNFVPRNDGNVVSFQEAQATKAALMRDTGFVTKWNNGDMEAIKQMAALDSVIVGNQPEDDEAVFRRQLGEMGRR